MYNCHANLFWNLIILKKLNIYSQLIFLKLNNDKIKKSEKNYRIHIYFLQNQKVFIDSSDILYDKS